MSGRRVDAHYYCCRWRTAGQMRSRVARLKVLSRLGRSARSLAAGVRRCTYVGGGPGEGEGKTEHSDLQQEIWGDLASIIDEF